MRPPGVAGCAETIRRAGEDRGGQGRWAVGAGRKGPRSVSPPRPKDSGKGPRAQRPRALLSREGLRGLCVSPAEAGSHAGGWMGGPWTWAAPRSSPWRVQGAG